MDSGNVLFSRWNFADAPYSVLSGGSWLAAMPVSKVQGRLLADVARSSDVALASTIIKIDLDSVRLVQLIALLGHSMTPSARIRVTGWDDQARTIAHPNADTGWTDVFPPYAAPSQLQPEDKNWMTGRPTVESLDRLPRVWFTVFGAPKAARFWTIEIDDRTNPAGYVDVGRLFVSPILQPSVNFVYGSTFGWAAETTYTRSKGGVKFFDYQYPYRSVSLQLNYLEKNESYYAVMEMKRRLGKDKEFFVCLFPNDVQYRQLFSFQANFEALPTMTWQTYKRQSFSFELQEAL